MGVAVSPRKHLRRTGRRPRLTFDQYLKFRLGASGGKTAWFNFFIKPFGAASFAEFWRLWNPVYGYFLYYYSYRPLSRLLPRAVAVQATFVVCGFLHDVAAWALTRRILPPGATLALSPSRPAPVREVARAV